ncbi:MAG TPA: hypothetical protein VKJ45_07125, partial [Blastocatellia bacterium]|nr:hypothetical protein [Blastocatellia bacterium]
MLATDRGLRCLLAIMCLLVTGGSSFGQRTARYTRPVVAGQQEPAAVLARAKTVLGFDRVTKPIMHYHAVAAAEQNYQSDRTYPPFFSAMLIKEAWFDSRSGVERISAQTTFPGGGQFPVQVSLTDA